MRGLNLVHILSNGIVNKNDLYKSDKFGQTLGATLKQFLKESEFRFDGNFTFREIEKSDQLVVNSKNYCHFHESCFEKRKCTNCIVVSL